MNAWYDWARSGFFCYFRGTIEKGDEACLIVAAILVLFSIPMLGMTGFMLASIFRHCLPRKGGGKHV
jgi:hypothetical protein